MQSIKKILLVGGLVGVCALVLFTAWYFLFRQPTPTTNTQTPYTINNSQTFTTNNPVGGGTPTTQGKVDQSAVGDPNTKIFKVTDGPVAAAVFIELRNPTTTLARYVMQDSGHVLELPLGVPGAIARVVSNTTVPGINNALWVEQGRGLLLQYTDQGVIKTVYEEFATSSNKAATASPSKIQFLPNNIIGISGAPSGTQIAYLMRAKAGGVVAFTANPDGSKSSALFTFPLSQVLLSWPSQVALLLQTKSASGVPGMAYSVIAKTGSISPLVYANSLSATANQTFSKVVYQSTPGATRITYAHDIKSGRDLELPFNPFPERCVWSAVSTNTMYCAAPLDSTPTNYLDLWHQGLGSVADSIFAFEVGQALGKLVAFPGSKQGGTADSIASMALSSRNDYLLYTTRGVRALWGVHISQ